MCVCHKTFHCVRPDVISCRTAITCILLTVFNTWCTLCVRTVRVASLQNVSFCTSRYKFEWQSGWRFEFRVYPLWRLERSEQTVWNSPVSALQQLVTGMARFFQPAGVSSYVTVLSSVSDLSNSGSKMKPQLSIEVVTASGLVQFTGRMLICRA